MNMQQDAVSTIRIALRAGARNWLAYAALAGMLMTIGGMVGLMWFVSFEPGFGLHAMLCGALSVGGLLLWNGTLGTAMARDRTLS
ncbi:MAG: hypothetical protein V4508_11995 [Pseudomonadota bacterium]